MSTEHSGSGESATGSPFKKFTLSADAPEFVPRFAQPQFNMQPQMSGGDQINMGGRGVQMDPQYSQDDVFQSNGNVGAPGPQDNCGTPLESFRSAVITLGTQGNVEAYLKPIVARLRDVTDMDVLNEMIEILYNESVSVVNYPYTGARICQYLAQELKTHPAFSNFRSLFLQKCKSAYDNREALLADPNALSTLCNLSMFIGELFLVLDAEVDGQVQKLGFLREAISNLLLTLLSKPDDDTVKCATQLLKLTGFEITKNSHLPGDFTETYNIIRSLEKHPSLNRTSHCLINSVLSRLDNNWGVQIVS